MNDDDQPNPKRLLPRLDISTGINHSPHVVILGAGASRACCPKCDMNGLKLPVMNDFVETVGVERTIRNSGHESAHHFEEVYSRIHEKGNMTIPLMHMAPVRSTCCRKGYFDGDQSFTACGDLRSRRTKSGLLP